jgi:deferrochelatase/peroxidase EfeB
MHGFRYLDDRDLMGFVDVTENPRGQASEWRPCSSPRKTPHSVSRANDGFVGYRFS